MPASGRMGQKEAFSVNQYYSDLRLRKSCFQRNSSV